MIYYKFVKVTVNTPSVAEIIIDVIMRYHGFPNLIVTNQKLFFTSKFCLLLCYFFDIKRELSTAFYPQIHGQIKRQNNMIEVYLGVFINFKQNDWIQLLFMAEFAYNNAKNASISYTLFKPNCWYYSCIFFKKKEIFNLRFKLTIVEELSFELWKLMTIY